jgi:putative addiction module killer protein
VPSVGLFSHWLIIVITYDIYKRALELTLREYVTPEGRNPFRDWLDALDLSMRARIQARVLRFETGNLGDHKAVGGGVWEARLGFGPGYRIYFGREKRTVVLLLLGGDKPSQRRDVRQAQQFWTDYREATHHGKAQ